VPRSEGEMARKPPVIAVKEMMRIMENCAGRNLILTGNSKAFKIASTMVGARNPQVRVEVNNHVHLSQ